MSPEAGPRAPRSRAIALGALAAFGGYLLVVGWLLRPAGGLHGRYFTLDGDGRAIEVLERVDRALDFPVPQRIDAAYLFHWKPAALGFPAAMPPYRVRWTGLLRVPREGVYGFAAEIEGELEVRIDDRPLALAPGNVTERRLAAGLHPIAIDYSLDRGEARLVLKRRGPGGSLRPFDAGDLAPDLESIGRARARRFWGWGLLAAGAAAAALGTLRARRAGGRAARLAAAIAAEREILALGLILMLAASLRFDDYALAPFHHETADEYQHAWEGWRLLHDRAPAAWSIFPDLYPKEQTTDFRWFGERYILVQPYFDHPPLFSILIGLTTSLAGRPTYERPWDFLSSSLPVMRLVPILLSLAGLVLVRRLAIVYGATPRAALLGALVYAVLPPLILAHRLVKGESLLALLFMGAILAVERPRPATARAGAGIAAGTLCGLALWTKATGVAVVVTVIVLLLGRRRRREAAVVAAITAGFAALYVAYAWAYDLGIFLEVLRAQATTKWVSMDAMLDLLGGKVVVQWFGRGWYLWLLLAAGVAAWRRQRALLLPLAVYATIIALTADHRVVYGWYRIPIYPFLCVAAGVYLDDMLREADLYHAFPFAATAVVTGGLYALPAGAALSRPAMMLFAAVALVPFLVREAFDGPLANRLARGATHLLLLLFLAGCLWVGGGLLEIYAAYRGMP